MKLQGILFHCPCYKSPADLEVIQHKEGNSSDFDDDTQLCLSDSRTAYSLFSLEELYFCDDCHVQRCPRCVMEEIVSIFCPNCLFEVPSKVGSSESHCPRNCFACPQCQAALQTVQDPTGEYKLRCTYCRWSTSAVGLVLNKPTGIANQIESQRENRQLSSFEKAKSIFEKRQHVEKETESGRILRRYRMAMGHSSDMDKIVDTSLSLFEAEQDVDITALLANSKLDHVTTMRERTLQNTGNPVFTHDLLPLRTRLRTKRTKRCRQCRYLLVKPDPKPLSINFRSRRYAVRVLPTMSLHRSKTTMLSPGITSQWILRLSNPLPEKCSYSLATASRTEDGDSVVISCPEFTIGATSEVWEDSALSTGSTRGELFEAGKNYASIILQITAKSRTTSTPGSSDLKADEKKVAPLRAHFPVFVQMSYHIDADLHGSEEKQGSLDRSERIEKEIGFWTVLDTDKAKVI